MIIGFLILLVLGTLVTLYFLKPGWLNINEEGFIASSVASTASSASSSTQEIYLVSNVAGSPMSYPDAVYACATLGGRLAVATEVYTAAEAGTNWTTPGWIGEDKTNGYIPVSAGNRHSGVNGPAVVRWNAEINTDCDGNISASSPGSAICYGLLASTTKRYTVTPNNGTFVSVDTQMLDVSGETVPSATAPIATVPGVTVLSVGTTDLDLYTMFDTTNSITLLDLDAINIQKNIMSIDIEHIKDRAYTIEKSLTASLTLNRNPIDIDDDEERRIQLGFFIATNKINYIEELSKFFVSQSFGSDPFETLVSAFKSAASYNNPIDFRQYLNILLTNINGYYSNIVSKLNSHPLAYITSGALNTPMYVNAFGLIPLEEANSWQYNMVSNSIYKMRTPPYPGCGTFFYQRVPIDNAWRGQNANTVTLHCPGGWWWRDKRTFSSAAVNRRCPSGYSVPVWDAFNCYKEYPQLNNEITIRDIDLQQISSMTTIQSVVYPTTFLARQDGWIPTAASTDAISLLNNFKANKTRVATTYGITDTTNVNKSYRWKPVRFLGSLTPLNKTETKKSAIFSGFFNFSDYSLIENQIRIASTPPFNLYFSKLGNARREFIDVIMPAVPPGANIESLTQAVIALQVTATVVGIGAAALSARNAAVAPTTVSRFMQRAATLGQVVSVALSSTAVGLSASNVNRGSAASLVMSAFNADYNSTICTPFNTELFNLLPYHTREFISFWGILRKSAVLSWFVTNVLNAGSSTLNPPGGPYQGSPLAAATARSWSNVRNMDSRADSRTTDVNGTTIYDISSNLFRTGAGYMITTSQTINTITSAPNRNKIYDSMAQTYYTLNGGSAYITKIMDVFQIATTLYDVRFTESRRSGRDTFLTKIADLNTQYNSYRYMQLSELQLVNLETSYASAMKTLYESENNNLMDSATNCGSKAQYVKITKTGTNSIRFNTTQVMVINNYGVNVAFGQNVTASSCDLASYEDMSGTTYYDRNFFPYSTMTSARMAATDNSGTILTKLLSLTDGTYFPRYDVSYKSKATDTTAWIKLNLSKKHDVSVVQILYNDSMKGFVGKVELFLNSTDTTPVASKDFTCDTDGSKVISFLRADRSVDLPNCPTDVYSQYKVGRFFATTPSIITTWESAPPASRFPLLFGGYGDGAEAATTFNPLYNSSFKVDTTDDNGNVNYTPVTIFNITPEVPIENCNHPDRIKRIFKDHLLNITGSLFTSKPCISTLSVPYHSDYLYKPAKVESVANATTGRYSCAYIWKENVYNADDGSIVRPNQRLNDGTILSTTLNSEGQITRYGIFKYEYDTSNWVSRGIVYDLSNSVQFNTRAQLTSTITGNSGGSLTDGSISLYVPYFHSLTLDTGGSQCPQTDCSDPDVINSIVTVYNNYPSVSTREKIIRITKAVTTATNKCEYQYATISSLSSILSFTVNLNVSTCKYAPLSYTSTGVLRPTVLLPSYLSDSTPLLAKAYNYASDTIAPFTDRISELYTELYTNYIGAQITGTDGILEDLIGYRRTTNTAAGQIRNVSIIGNPVLNEFGSTCTTQCNSPEIIQSFFVYWNNRNDDRVTEIQNVGMDGSGNCDFTYSTSPINYNNGVASLGTTGTTRAARFKIERFINSCAYSVKDDPRAIMPVPNISSIMNFSSLNVFGTVPRGQIDTINTSQTGIVGLSSVTLNASGTPFRQLTGPLTETTDYINCLSKYAMASIYRLGVTGSVTAVKNIDAKTCAINIGGVQRQFEFIPQTSVVGITAPLVASPAPGTTASNLSTIPTLNITSLSTLTSASAISCSSESIKQLTGLSQLIVASKTVSQNTCEYKITANNSLPFANTFQRASFYTGSLTNISGTDIHLASLTNSNPATSPFAYFQNINSTFINDYMALLQFCRYTWNAQFYSKTPKNTSYWKIGKILAIGVLANDDAFVIEAKSSLFGQYGSLDIRDYATRYFKFSPRINTLNGIDPNNYSVSPFRIDSISIYKSEDSDTTFGPYRAGPFIPTDSQYDSICTYLDQNYNNKWFDLSGGTGTPPSTAPPATYTVQPIETSLTYGYYNQVRFTVTKSQMSGTGARAEVASLMFYDISGYTSTYQPIYAYTPIINGTVKLQNVSSTYFLAETGKPTCDVGFRAIMDPEINQTLCIYEGNISASYTQSTPCNTGDTTLSKINNMYSCVTITTPTYTKIAGVACGIGYFGDINGTVCSLTGNFQQVIQNPSLIFNTNAAVPRLRVSVNESVTIHFNTILHIAGFSFITGSSGTLPLQWTLEGSMNGISWATIHCQRVDYNYAGASPKSVNGTRITSFFTPGIFLTNQKDSSRGSCTSIGVTTGQMTDLGYSVYNVPSYTTMASNIQEGFQGQRAYRSKVQKRIQILKFKILETYDPNSKFVHMSQLEFLTSSGKIPNSIIRLSNLQGSRNSPKEGITAILEGTNRRWVDYNKSDVLIQFTEPTDPIIGFRFCVPQGVPSAMNAMPVEWTLSGSYDRQTWKVLHEYSSTSLPLVNSFATIVFKLDTM